MIALTVYSRRECHLCEQMVADLESLVQGVASIDVVDISADPALEQDYGAYVPVLKAGDFELSRFRLDRERVAGFLADLS